MPFASSYRVVVGYTLLMVTGGCFHASRTAKTPYVPTGVTLKQGSTVIGGNFILPSKVGWQATVNTGQSRYSTSTIVVYRRTIQGVPATIRFRYEQAPSNKGRYPATLQGLQTVDAGQVQFHQQLSQKYPNSPVVLHLPSQATRFHGKPALFIHTITRDGQTKNAMEEKQLYIGDANAHYDFTLRVAGKNVPPHVLAEAERDWNALNAAIRPAK